MKNNKNKPNFNNYLCNTVIEYFKNGYSEEYIAEKLNIQTITVINILHNTNNYYY